MIESSPGDVCEVSIADDLKRIRLAHRAAERSAGREVEERQRLRVEHVGFVQQRDPDVDVGQAAHRSSDAFLLHEPAHVLGGDDFLARGQQRVARLRPNRGRGRHLAGLDALPRALADQLVDLGQQVADRELTLDEGLAELRGLEAQIRAALKR